MITSVFKKLFLEKDGYEYIPDDPLDQEARVDTTRILSDRYMKMQNLPFEMQFEMIERLSASPAELHAFKVYLSDKLGSVANEKTKIQYISSYTYRR